ncbi:ketol-acid reductoisomerase [Sedimentitalea sp. JM2-8]|uniref:Ketol-acid reductoisomerase n=2 Tax=Sedimentitalea xiamensis TaxID=3050037 RepID=A0ABT7FHF8_9RHOB|nr:ketol-acid reductoisomerase [Sedimentitalea xiamensis]
MTKWYFDDDADLKWLQGKTIGIFGYGNQGRSQALNMRDAGLEVVVGSRSDESAKKSEEDGFETLPLAEAAAKADVLFILVPDEVMPQIYKESLEPGLKPGDTLVFASGYNIHFKYIQPALELNVIMIAPRMVGQGVRDTVLAGTGFPSLVAVHQDADGKAQNIMLALSRAIGSTKMGVIESSFEEETIVDLFHEQFGSLHAIRRAIEVLTEAGCSPEAAMLEMYASGEVREIGQYYVDHGLFGQLKLHSRTSEYGQLVYARGKPEQEEAHKDHLRGIVERIRDGSFAREWTDVQANGMTALKTAQEEIANDPMTIEERKLYERLGRFSA